MRAQSQIRIVVAFGLWAACGIGPVAAGDWYADFGGRWTARTASGAFCSLGFAGGPDVPHGTISATGFCPEIFLTRPVWWLEGSNVVIGTRRHAALAYLSTFWRGRLEGIAATGERISLTR